jgi:hypothetical protein
VRAADSGDVGVVADQDPKPGAQVRAGTQVVVFVPIAAPVPPSDDDSSTPVAAVLVAAAAVVLIWLVALLVRASLRRRARRRTLARLRVVIIPGETESTLSSSGMGPPTHVIRVQGRPDPGSRQLEELVP